MSPETDARSQRILEAASGLFLRYGFTKATVDDIAHAAGISKGAVYLETGPRTHPVPS